MRVNIHSKGKGNFILKAIIIVTFHYLSINTSFANEKINLEKESFPTEEHALSLWLIARTGWVLCDRTVEFMKKTHQEFDLAKCQQCYVTLFHSHKAEPNNVSNQEILACVESFGVSRTYIPAFSFPPSPVEFVHQNLFESLAVQPLSCNSELPTFQINTPQDRNRMNFRHFALPALRQLTQLLSVRGFSYRNDPKADYPRRSYVTCLLGALFEIELSLCPMTAERRRCAAQQKEADEDKILSKSVPINYS